MGKLKSNYYKYVVSCSVSSDLPYTLLLAVWVCALETWAFDAGDFVLADRGKVSDLFGV